MYKSIQRIFLFLLLTNICFAKGKFEKQLLVNVSLSPIGSFKIISSKVRGKIFFKNKILYAKNIRIPVSSLKTGIDLRDTHLHRKLGGEKNKRINLVLIEATGQNNKGIAKIKILNKIQSLPFSYSILNKKMTQANFKISLDKFSISDIKYMGVGVNNIVDVTIVLPYISK